MFNGKWKLGSGGSVTMNEDRARSRIVSETSAEAGRKVNMSLFPVLTHKNMKKGFSILFMPVVLEERSR